MEDELSLRIKSIEEKVNENNKMLHSLRNGQRNARFFKLIYFGIIIALSVYSLKALAPYLTQLSEVYGTVNTLKEKTGSLNLNSVNNLIKDFTK